MKKRQAFRYNGYMMDCSRNAVPTVETVKEMVRMMALMGLDSPTAVYGGYVCAGGEPYFGYMRGRYTEAELREIDDFAFALGVEIVPCIRRWPICPPPCAGHATAAWWIAGIS